MCDERMKEIISSVACPCIAGVFGSSHFLKWQIKINQRIAFDFFVDVENNITVSIIGGITAWMKSSHDHCSVLFQEPHQTIYLSMATIVGTCMIIENVSLNFIATSMLLPK